MAATISTRRKKSKIRTLQARDGDQCWYCLCEFDADHIRTLDHIVPLAKGGTNANDNLRLACYQCNLRKGARLGPFARGIWYNGRDALERF